METLWYASGRRGAKQMDRSCRSPAVLSKGFALVELLVVMVVLVGLAALYFGMRGKGEKAEPKFEGEAQTTLGKAVQKGESVECQNDLRQLRLMIQMEAMEGSNPAQLNASWGVSLHCPVSGYPYEYNPQTGQVWCPTPGHQDY